MRDEEDVMVRKGEDRPVDKAERDNQPSARSSSLITQDSLGKMEHVFIDLSIEILRSGKSIRFRAPGRSMYPTIKPDETITVKPMVPSAVHVGDIVLYRREEKVIAHRVVRIEQGHNDVLRFIMRGDASTICDTPVAAEEILGRVVSVERTGRRIDLYGRRANTMRLTLVLVSRLRRRMIHWLHRLAALLAVAH